MIRNARVVLAVSLLGGLLVLDGLGESSPRPGSRRSATRPRSRRARRPGTRPATGPGSRPSTRPATRPALPLILPFPAVSTRPAATSAPTGATESICRAALRWFDRAMPMIDKLVPVAERAADHLLAGGNLYVGGNDGFADEFDFRAGGFPFTIIWTGQRIKRNDVLLLGSFRPNETGNRHSGIDYLARGYQGRSGDGMTVHFSGHAWCQVGRLLPVVNKRWWRGRLCLVDTGAPEGASLEDLCIGQMSAAALAWALHGEIMSAATRKGKTLATYASDWEPNGRAWDASVRGKHEHPKFKVPPIPAGRIGRQYLTICREQLADFLATQCGQVRMAGRRMAECMRRGGVVWAVHSSHINPRGAVVPRELTRLKMFGRSYAFGYYLRRMPAGDLLLYMGYLRYPAREVRAVLGRGADAVVVTVDAGPTNDHLTHVRSCWKDYDTVIDLPDYPIRVLASSGVVQTPQWYALMAETLAAQRAPRPAPGVAGR